MSTQQDIYAAGFENRPLMLNKDNYVPWSSRLLRYGKSRRNGKLIHNSIINGPYVRRMIPEPCDPNRKVLVNETFHVQTDNELTEKELKHIEADDQAIQTILLNLPEDIYAAVDSCETAQKIWLHVQQMMKADYTQLYDFLKYNQKEVDDLKAERLAKIQDPLALMATSKNPYTFPVLHQDQPSFNQNYMQQPMLNPKDIIDLTTAMNMALALMAKAFKLNYSTPTNNNQRISSNPRNRNQFRQYVGQNVGNLNGYNDVQNVGNQVIHNAVQNPRIHNVGNQNGLIGVPCNANQNPNKNGNLVAARAEGNATRHNGIQLQDEEFDLMVVAADLDEIKEVNANCILMANLQQASTLGTQTDKALVYDSDGSAEVVVILGFGDLQWGNILITRVYFVEGLGHNLFSVGKFCDSGLEVAFGRNACFIRNIEGVDLLSGKRTTNLYTINLHEMASASPICLMARASSTKSWLWHQRLSISILTPKMTLPKTILSPVFQNSNIIRNIFVLPVSKEKAKEHLTHPNVSNSRQRLHLLHMDLCGPMRIASINGKGHVLVIVDDYSRYTWVHFLRSKDEAPENDHEDIGKLGAKGDIGFFIGYSADSCAYRVFNRRTKKIMETMNVSFDELLAMAFEQRSNIVTNSCVMSSLREIVSLTFSEAGVLGYVAFGWDPKGGKISGKGKIKAGKLDFDDVYFVKELKFNLFSVSQMCDKKNSVLFIDIECVVLSSDYTLLDENHVLLRVPRENYNTPKSW
nr:hypothetical protein [Tanacetum cinerariifolium]